MLDFWYCFCTKIQDDFSKESGFDLEKAVIWTEESHDNSEDEIIIATTP